MALNRALRDSGRKHFSYVGFSHILEAESVRLQPNQVCKAYYCCCSRAYTAVYTYEFFFPTTTNKLHAQYDSIASLPRNTCIGVPLTTTDPHAGIPEPCGVAGKGDKAVAQ